VKRVPVRRNDRDDSAHVVIVDDGDALRAAWAADEARDRARDDLIRSPGDVQPDWR
jgi:hypothetical protein